MHIDELRNSLQQVIQIRDEIKGLSAKQKHRYPLSGYIDQFQNYLIYVDHGDRDRFYVPYADASIRLSHLQEVGDKEINAAFSTNKTKLLSCLNQYIKGLKHGLQEYEKETIRAPRHQ